MPPVNLSHFSLDNEVKTSFEIGDLIPFSWLDVVPGDQIRQSLSSLVRLQPLIAPVMHGLKFYSRFYYVPYRLLMKNFEKMLIDPDSPLVVPTLYDVNKKLVDSEGSNANILTKNILNEYNLLRQFGIHSDNGSLSEEASKFISVFPFFAYQLIYNYYYKDPILDSTYKDDFDPALDFDIKNLFTIRKVRYLKDYFTSTLPNTQYGSEVSLDMDGNNVIKVNEMRLAERLQVFKEKLLVHGARYLDFLKTFFDTAPSSAVLQQPQYLGGGTSLINISDVDQMVGDDKSPLGNVAGKSASVVGDNGYEQEFYEHGIVLGLCFIKPEQSYTCGIPRSFIKRDFYSFYNPTFANIGMQETYGCELSANRADTFGYNERYAELKYNPSVVCGDMSETLHFWHFGRDIRNRVLNNDFLLCEENTSPFAVQSFRWNLSYRSSVSFYILYDLNSSSKPCMAIGPSGQDDEFFSSSAGSNFKVFKEWSFDDYYIVLSDAYSHQGDSFIYFSPRSFYNNKNLPLLLGSDVPLDLFLAHINPRRSDYTFGYRSSDVFSKGVYFGQAWRPMFAEGVSVPRFYINTNEISLHSFSPMFDDSLIDYKRDGVSPFISLNFPLPDGLADFREDSLINLNRSILGITSSSMITNHCLAVFGNNIEALRPIPKSDRVLI